MTTRAAIYCRVSTEGQEDNTSLGTQLERCQAYCRERGYQVVMEYSETYSGLALSRPKLDELRDNIRGGAIDILIVYAVDRLSRDPTHGVIITQELERCHTSLEAVSETIENSELGKLITYIRGFASKVEAEKIKERTSRGKASYLKQGMMPFGTGYGLYGYSWQKGGPKEGITQPRLINDYEAQVVRRIFNDLAAGKGRFTVARELNQAGIPSKSGKKWHPQTIGHIATNLSYIGETWINRYKRVNNHRHIELPKENWKLLPNVTPAIIDKPLFERVQAILNRPKPKPLTEYLLTGHIFCAACNGHMVGASLQRKHRYYSCRHTRPTASETASCKSRYVRADFIEGEVWTNVANVLKSPDTLLKEFKRQAKDKAAGIPARINEDIKLLNNRLAKYPAQEQGLKRALMVASEKGYELDDQILDNMNQLKKERQVTESRLAELLKQKIELKQWQDAEVQLNQFCQDHRQNIDRMNLAEKRLALDALNIKVIASPERYEVTGSLGLVCKSAQSTAEKADVTTIERTSA